MGRKGHYNYSDQVKTQIVEARQEGKTLGQIAKDFEMPKASVQSILNHFKKFGNVDSGLKNNGPARKTHPDIDCHIVKLARQNPGMTVREIQADLRAKGLELSRHTIRRRFKGANLPLPSQQDKKCKRTKETIESIKTPPSIEQLVFENRQQREEIAELRNTVHQLRQMLNESKTLCYSCHHQYS